jgi:hypothetical protein
MRAAVSNPAPVHLTLRPVDGRYPHSKHWRVRLGWSIAVLAFAAQTAAYLTNELVLDRRFHQLDIGADGTVFAWANTLAIVSLAVLVALSAARRLNRVWRAAALVLGLGLLALDDATGAHDRLTDLRADSLPGRPEDAAVVALAVFVGLLAAVFVLLWAESGRISRGARWTMRAGLLTLAAAVAVRVGGAAFGRETVGGTVGALGIAGEQGLDLVGWILLAAGYAAGFRDSAGAQSSSPPPHWPAFTATVTEKPRPASITAPTLPPGAAKTRRFSR